MVGSSREPRPGRLRLGEFEVGFALMAVATLLLPVGDTLSKLLTRVVPPVEVAFWRLAFQSGVLGLAALALRRRAHGNPFSPVLAAGGITTATTLVFLVMAFSEMPIATAIVIFFVEPLILTVLSVLFLGETAGWRRYAAVAVGLLGALVVIRPNWSTFGVYSVYPLGAAVAFAFNMVLIRLASRTHSALTIQCGMSIYATVILGAGMLAATATGVFSWAGTAAPVYVWPTYALMGIVAGATFLLIAEAFRRAPASVLAPVQYLEIVGATLMGLLVFGDFPDLLTWVGTAIILTSGLYVFYRERSQKTGAPSPKATAETARSAGRR